MYFHGNTEHFYFVDSYVYADNSKKGKVLVRFQWQQWLRECATM